MLGGIFRDNEEDEGEDGEEDVLHARFTIYTSVHPL